MLILLSLLGCPAEMLGVQIPAGGVESLQMEDFNRDADRFLHSERRAGMPRHQQGRQDFMDRLVQMHLLPVFDKSFIQGTAKGEVHICGERLGRGNERVVVAAVDTGVGAHRSAAGLAALISLAKTYDTNEPPPRGVVFCRVGAGAQEAFIQDAPLGKVEAVIWLEDLGQGTLQVTRQDGEPEQLRVSGAREDWYGTKKDTLSSLHLETLLQQTMALRELVDQELAAP